MKFSIITLFPDSLKPILDSSIIGRAQKKGLIEIELIDLRPFGEGRHQVVDDRPYGGGVGMVLRADILARAWQSIKKNPKQKTLTILTSASGSTYTQKIARAFVEYDHLIIICGHYEGVDQRFIDHYVDREISIGDYVLTGGEIPSLVIVDSVSRLIKDVLTKEEATLNESFENDLLEYPHYTHPEVFEENSVPEVLISGHHQKVEEWRKEASIKKTRQLRPDLLKD